jgi:hypothetical protein
VWIEKDQTMKSTSQAKPAPLSLQLAWAAYELLSRLTWRNPRYRALDVAAGVAECDSPQGV